MKFSTPNGNFDLDKRDLISYKGNDYIIISVNEEFIRVIDISWDEEADFIEVEVINLVDYIEWHNL